MSFTWGKPTPEVREAMDAWLREHEAVREIAEKTPPWNCYRERGKGGHYTIVSYSEDGTLMVLHGRDSFNAGFAVSGIPAERLEVCNCGHYEYPTNEDVSRTARRLRVTHRIDWGKS